MPVLEWWLAHRALGRLAIAGLAMGLIVLAALTIGGTGESEATTQRVRAFNTVGVKWQQVSIQLAAEEGALREYLTTGGSAYRRPALLGVIDSATEDLNWLEDHGGRLDVGEVRMLRVNYAAYQDLVQLVLDDPDPATLSGYKRLAAVRYAQMQVIVLRNIDRTQRELVQFLAEADERTMVLRWIATGVAAAGLVLCVVSSVLLVGYQRRAERESAENRHKATHDPLTGLANRQLLATETKTAIRAAGATGEATGLLLIDLDRFKNVNDALGHHVGDLLLRRIADRLVRSSRGSDLVARLGGDEFAVLLRRVTSADDMATIAYRFRAVIQKPVVLEGLAVDVGASIGVAAFPVDAGTGEELLRHADVAMYVAKRTRAGVSRYSRRDDDNDPVDLIVVGELRRGIGRGELVLHYQPKIDAVTRDPVGLEALVRWRHPELGLLPPGTFIHLIEPTELINDLTAEVLRLALHQMREWDASGRAIPVAVNIAARSLLDPHFPDLVLQLLREYQVDPSLLVLELTESALITAPVQVTSALRRMREHGVRSSIYDFGTGYSSMSFLRAMPVGEIKIDRRFVMAMLTDDQDRAIVDATIYLARNLSLDVVAEGVEDEATAILLRELGCQILQGYFISRPVPAEMCAPWLDRYAAARAGNSPQLAEH